MRDEVTDREEGVAAFPVGRAFATLGVGGLAAVLALLPALVALGWSPAPDFVVVAAALAVVLGVAKAAAALWGLAARVGLRPRLGAVAGSIDR